MSGELKSLQLRKGLADLCSRLGIAELFVFGSFARETTTVQSDIDLLIAPMQGVRWSLLDLAEIRSELSSFFGKEVDLITMRAVEESANPFFKQEVLNSKVSLYEAPRSE